MKCFGNNNCFLMGLFLFCRSLEVLIMELAANELRGSDVSQ